MLPVLWSQNGLEDVDAIAAYISTDNPAAADRLTDLIFEAAEKLSFSHALYRAGRRAGTREMVVHPNYILVYRTGVAQVEVLRVLHARQLYP